MNRTSTFSPSIHLAPVASQSRRPAYVFLAWLFTGSLLLSFLPRALIERPGFQLFVERATWGVPALGIIGLALLPGIACAVGRGAFVSSMVAYVVLQGTMRRFLITDSGLPQLLVFWDNVPVVVLLVGLLMQQRSGKMDRLARRTFMILLASAGVALLSVVYNAVPEENALLGFGRSVIEGPLWLVVLLLVRLPLREKTRLFFELSTVLLLAHVVATLASLYSAGDFGPGDGADGAYGWGGANYLSLTGGMMLLFLAIFPTRARRSKNDLEGYAPSRIHKRFLLIGWGFLFIWGASRFAIVAVVALFALWLVVGNFRHRFSGKYFGPLVLFILLVTTFLMFQLGDQEGSSPIHLAKSPADWLADWGAVGQYNVNRGAVAQYNLDLLNGQPQMWVWGAGPGMYHSATGNTLQAPLAVEALLYFGGRYVPPMYLTDMLVEYGAVGLGLILLVPVLTVIALAGGSKTGRNRHPARTGYTLVVLLMMMSLTTFSTLEFRGVMVLMYLMAAVVLSHNEQESNQLKGLA